MVIAFVRNKFSFGLKREYCFPGLTWLNISIHHLCVLWVPTQPATPGGQQCSLRDSVGTWKELWSQILRGTCSSHPQMLYTLSKPLHLLEPVFSFANEVLGLLVPESLPAMTFQTAHPGLVTLYGRLPAQGRCLELPWLVHIPGGSKCMQTVLRSRTFSEEC